MRLIGRGEERARVEGLLAEGRQGYVLLWGAPGIGKSALARDILLHPPASVVQARMVEGRSLSEPKEIVVSCLRTWGVEEIPEGGEDVLARILARALPSEHSLLLIVDNIDHMLAEATGWFVCLQQYLPKMRILATSRERSEHRLENPLQLLSLSNVPREGGPSEAELLLQDQMERLGIKRDLSDGHTRRDLESLLPLLDGVPLALVLAASQLEYISPAELTDQLKSGYSALVQHGASVEHTHRSLEAAIASSWDRLSEEARMLLMHLSCAPKEFDASFAQELVSDGRTVFSELVRSAMVSSVSKAEGRRAFFLLDSIRWFAHNRIKDPKTKGAWKLPWLGRALADMKALTGSGSEDARSALDALFDGLAAIVDEFVFSPSKGEVSLAFDALRCMAPTAERRGMLSGTIQRIRAFRKASVGMAEDVQLGLLHSLEGHAHHHQSDWKQARICFEEALRHVPEYFPETGKVLAVRAEGEVRLRLPTAQASIDRAEQWCQTFGGSSAHALVLNAKALLLHEQGRYQEAKRMTAATAVLLEEQGYVQSACHALMKVAFWSIDLEEYEDAKKAIAHAEGLLQKHPSKRLQGQLHGYRGNFLRATARWEEAVEEYNQASALLTGAGDHLMASVFSMDGGIACLLANRSLEGLKLLMQAISDKDALQQSPLLRDLVEIYLTLGGASKNRDTDRHATMGSVDPLVIRYRRWLVWAMKIEMSPTKETVEGIRQGLRCEKGPTDAHERCMLQLLCDRLDRIDPAQGLLAFRGNRFRAPKGSEWVLLPSQSSALRLLRHLAQSPEHVFSVGELQAVGWPEERMDQEAGANRVRVAVAQLRRLGLYEQIERVPEGGYRLCAKILWLSEEKPDI